MFVNKTIVANATANGKAGVAIIRVSGKQCKVVLQNITGLNWHVTKPRYAKKAKFKKENILIDVGLVIIFPGPNSFTGEDVIEFHCHGSFAVIDMLLSTISSLPNVRIALPGEFTRRAFNNDKMDLLQVEGLADLIDAETERQLIQAHKHSSGQVSQNFLQWRKIAIECMAYIEAYIDFSDEDIEEDVAKIDKKIEQLNEQIIIALDNSQRGQSIRSGYNIAIAGKANSGKSTLINTLSNNNIAIVSDIPGTTRDVLRSHINFFGYPVNFFDTAGIRETQDVIEKEGIKRALQCCSEAKLLIYVVDINNIDEIDSDYLSYLQNINSNVILVANKVDTCEKIDTVDNFIFISAKQKINIDSLNKQIINIIDKSDNDNILPLITKHRHKNIVEQCNKNLLNYLATDHLELKAEEIRLFISNIDKIIGKFDFEDMLDIIFANFCIGK